MLVILICIIFRTIATVAWKAEKERENEYGKDSKEINRINW